MKTSLNRRRFLSNSILASAAVTSAGNLAADAAESGAAAQTVVPGSKGRMPAGKIGHLTVSRLISGGNLISDQWYNQGKTELLGKCVEFIRSQTIPAGIGAHKLEVIIEAEKLALGAEFYVKTLHHGNYWSARRPEQDRDVVENREDNYWEMTPDRTIAFMQEIEKPWIAFKVLAAGGIRPESGFRYAFEHGADFICVGMFDFQVEQNVALVRKLVPEWANRSREWMA